MDRFEILRPTFVVWEITLACNLGCSHCGSRAARPRADELTTAEALDVVEQFADIGIREITLIGGEAILREDWDTIAASITRRGMRCTMVIGGRGFDRDAATRARDAGIDHVSVSVDGLEETHDRLRGYQGSFRACLEALDRLSVSGIHRSVNTQLNRASAPELVDLFTHLAQLGLHAWRVHLTVPMGRAYSDPELLLQPHDLLELMPLLADLAVRAKKRGFRLDPGNNVGYFGPHESLLREHPTGPGHWRGCSAGVESLGLESDGTFKACPSLPTAAYAGGNVRDRRIADLLATPDEKLLPKRDLDDLWGFCRTCYYAETCRAGCSWTTHVFFGRTGNNPYCHHRALELADRGERERVRFRSHGDGSPFDHGRFELVREPLT